MNGYFAALFFLFFNAAHEEHGLPIEAAAAAAADRFAAERRHLQQTSHWRI